MYAGLETCTLKVPAGHQVCLLWPKNLHFIDEDTEGQRKTAGPISQRVVEGQVELTQCHASCFTNFTERLIRWEMSRTEEITFHSLNYRCHYT